MKGLKVIKMYATKNRILVIIIALLAKHSNAVEVKMADLSVSDTVNLGYFNSLSTNLYGDIFNGLNAAKYIEEHDSSSEIKVDVVKKICLPFESLASYYHPEIYVDDVRWESAEIFENRNRSIFDIHPKYTNKSYSYGIVKVCQNEKKQKLITEVLRENDFPIIGSRINYKLLLDKTAVLRFRQKHETHYVSFVSVGKCLVQAFVNSAAFCKLNTFGELPKNIDINQFLESSVDKSSVKTTSGIHDRENKINDYLTENRKSVDYLSDIKLLRLFYAEFNHLTENSIIKIHLKKLPYLSQKPLPPVIFHAKDLSEIVPGDVIDLEDFRNFSSVKAIDNFLVDVYDEKVAPFIQYNFTSCRACNKNDAVEIEYVPYGLPSKHSGEYFYKFDVLERMMKLKNYGVDPIFLNDHYKILKVKVCSELLRSKLIIPSVEVVNLDQNNPNKLHIFENKNIVLRYELGKETHYVAHTEKGNCLFQALIYQSSNDIAKNKSFESPLYKGKILSTNEDYKLEQWTQEFVDNLSANNTLMDLVDNPKYVSTVFSKLSREDNSYRMINIYLGKLY